MGLKVTESSSFAENRKEEKQTNSQICHEMKTTVYCEPVTLMDPFGSPLLLLEQSELVP